MITAHIRLLILTVDYTNRKPELFAVLDETGNIFSTPLKHNMEIMDQIKELASNISGAEAEWLNPELVMVDDAVRKKGKTGEMSLIFYFGQTVPIEPLVLNEDVTYRSVADILVDRNAPPDLIKTINLLRRKL